MSAGLFGLLGLLLRFGIPPICHCLDAKARGSDFQSSPLPEKISNRSDPADEKRLGEVSRLKDVDRTGEDGQTLSGRPGKLADFRSAAGRGARHARHGRAPVPRQGGFARAEFAGARKLIFC